MMLELKLDSDMKCIGVIDGKVLKKLRTVTESNEPVETTLLSRNHILGSWFSAATYLKAPIRHLHIASPTVLVSQLSIN